MPAPWSAGAECRIVGSLHGVETVNVWHFATNEVINDDPSLDTLLQQLITAMSQCVRDFLLPAVTSDWRFVQCDARRIAPTFSDPVIGTGTPADVGELSPTSHSVSCSLVSIRTGGGGKSGRGRKFLPPPGEAEIANSLINDATLLLIAAYLACVAEKFAGANATTFWRVGVLSTKKLHALGGSFDNAFREATQLSPVANVHYLGSRQIGHGR